MGHIFKMFFWWFTSKNYIGGLIVTAIYSACGVQHENESKAYLWIISALQARQLVPNYFLWPYKCPDFHLQINLPHFCANKLFSARGRHYSPFAYQLASLPKLSWGGIWRKELNLARNWLIIRSCQSPNLVRIECNADFLSCLQVVRDGSVGYLKRCNKKS